MRPCSQVQRAAHALVPSIREILSHAPPIPPPAAKATPASKQQDDPRPTSSSPALTTMNGWLRSVRTHKSVTFLEVSDGSSVDTLQAVWKRDGHARRVDRTESGSGSLKQSEEDAVDGLTLGTSLSLRGTLQRSKGKGQAVELVVREMEVLGKSDPETYPLQKKHIPPDVLRTHPHLRFRTAGFSAVTRVRDGMRRGWDDWFEANEFVHVQTPIMTSSDCEGAGEAFRVTTLPPPAATTSPTQDPPPPPIEDFYPNPSFLTVSAQLHLEAPAHALSRVYTLSPTFRAEPSATSRHLAEFWMLEAELGWLGFDRGDEAGEGSVQALGQVMSTLEDGLKGVIRGIVEDSSSAEMEGGGNRSRSRRVRADLEAVWESVGKDMEENQTRSTDIDPGRNLPSLPELTNLISKPFHRITYTRAIDLLQKRHHRTRPFDHPPVWGSSLQSEHEKYLAGWECLDGPVFVTDYPRALKPFYMRVNPEIEGVPGRTVSCFDLLIPNIGELAGGSVREERLAHLTLAIGDAGLNRAQYEWYLDLRKFGTVRHGGWGMGWERFVCWLTGVGNVRDVVPFPRWKGSCRF